MLGSGVHAEILYVDVDGRLRTMQGCSLLAFELELGRQCYCIIRVTELLGNWNHDDGREKAQGLYAVIEPSWILLKGFELLFVLHV